MRLWGKPHDEHDTVWGELASAWLDGELSGEERQEFALHSRACERCSTRLAGYQANSSRLKGRLNRVPATAPQGILAASRSQRHVPLPGGVRGRTAMAASAAVLLVSGFSVPQVRQAVSGAVAYVGCTAGAGCSESFAGDRAYFRAPAGSVIATASQRYSLFTGPAMSGSLAPAGTRLLPGGPIYGLAGGRILYQDDSAQGSAAWVTSAGNGSDQQPFPLGPQMTVVDLTPAGDRLLVRHKQAAGGLDPDPAQTLVIDQHGAPVWRGTDYGGIAADIQSLSPDGAIVLGVTAAGVQEISLADGRVLATIPTTGHPAQQPQLSRDGARMAFLQARVGPGEPALSVTYVDLLPVFQEPKSQPVPEGTVPVLRISPDGRWLALSGCPEGFDASSCAAEGKASLILWDLASRSAQGQEAAGFHGTLVHSLAWTADSSTLLVTGELNGREQAWTRTTGGDVNPVRATGQLVSSALLPEGGVAALSDGDRPSGTVAMTVSGGAEKVAPLSPVSGFPAFARGGGAVAILSAAAPPRLISRRGAAPAQLQRSVQAFAWAPDGGSGVALIDGQAYLWQQRSGLQAAPFAAATAVAWSADGKQIELADRGLAQRFDARGRRLGDVPADIDGGSLRWSPSGARLAGVSHRSDGDHLVLFDPGTGVERNLAQAAAIGSLAWSADGRNIAFASQESAGPGAASLQVVALGGTRQTTLAALDSGKEPIVWQGSNLVVFLERPTLSVAGRPTAVSVDGSRRIAFDLAAMDLAAGPGQ